MEHSRSEPSSTADIPSFKSKLQQKYFQPKTVPSYFSFGDRYLSVLHARLRNKCSSLNSDLFKSNLVPSASCSCGYKNECSEHFLLYCNKFNLLRNNMLIELNMLDMGGSTGKYRYFVIWKWWPVCRNKHVYIFMCTKIHKRYTAFLLN